MSGNRCDAIERVVWKQKFLDDIKDKVFTDRQGIMVIFKLKRVFNQPYVTAQAWNMLSHVFRAMGFHEPVGYPGEETCECFTYLHGEGEVEDEIHLRHKYWNKAQAAMFYDIINALATYHDWGVDYE